MKQLLFSALTSLNHQADRVLCLLSPRAHARWAAGWTLEAGIWYSPYCDVFGAPLCERAWLIEGLPLPEDPDFQQWHDAYAHHETADYAEAGPDIHWP